MWLEQNERVNRFRQVMRVDGEDAEVTERMCVDFTLSEMESRGILSREGKIGVQNLFGYMGKW